MSSNPMVARGGALAFEPGYADNAADALRNLRPATDVVDFELEHHHDAAGTAQLGFWVYLMSDCLLFAGLFATYSVLHVRTAGGPTPQGLFDLPYVLAETMFLLFSSFTCGLATLAAGRRSRGATLGWLAVTFVLGLAFVGMEVHEFAHMIADNAGPDRSAFLSSFFTLVATHGLHVTCGLVWMAMMMVLVVKKGFTPSTESRLACLSLFWHFLDIIWVGVFSLVYLFGVS
ncbi:MAG TPA: cytochrome o ubiquinol oxidase subunit III [Steroidobacteraceae bacterium]|nr:cytochrome o ubiquinol oxidase subunit III [Steroidobacteraceae bacterium]